MYNDHAALFQDACAFAALSMACCGFGQFFEQEVMRENGAEFGEDGVAATFGNDDAALSAASTGVAVRGNNGFVACTCTVPGCPPLITNKSCEVYGRLCSFDKHFHFSSFCRVVLQAYMRCEVARSNSFSFECKVSLTYILFYCRSLTCPISDVYEASMPTTRAEKATVF